MLTKPFALHIHAVYSWHEYHSHHDLAELNHLDGKQKRRLSSLAKLSLAARQGLDDCVDVSEADHILWCSSYGDEHKTLNIIQSIIDNEAPSPTAFATSVHNATAGLYSMLQQDDKPSSSLSVGVNEFTNALLYTYSLLKTASAKCVLIVVADEPLPETYQHRQLTSSYAMACLVSLADETHQANLSVIANTHNISNNQFPEAIVFTQFWHNQTASILQFPQWQLCKI